MDIKCMPSPFKTKLVQGSTFASGWNFFSKLLNKKATHNFPGFFDEYGFQLYSAVLEVIIHTILRRMQIYRCHKDEISKDL